MGEIQQGRYDRLLRRTTSQVGPGSKVGNALEDLFPMLEVENTPSELLRAVGWKLGAGQTTRNPAAGKQAVVQLFNPSGSRHLIVLTQIILSTNVAAGINSGPSFDALTRASIAGRQRDTRDGELRETVGLIQDEDDALVNNILQVFAVNDVYTTITDPNDIAVLSPGTGWRVAVGAINIALRITFLYRERVAEPEELDF